MTKMCLYFENVSFLSIVSFFIEKCAIFVDCIIISTECVIVSHNIKLRHFDTKCVNLAAQAQLLLDSSKHFGL